ncbi:MAG: plastocyanin/azurin family copper-binding protein [Nitrosopumilus sp.]|jgi:plastocyanin
MNFAYGIIAIVGILAAISIGFIAISPNDVIEPRVIDESQISESITSVEESIVKVPMTLIISLPAGSGVPGCDETNECFLPYDTTIGVGGTITWSNDDSAAHTVTSGVVADGPDGLFDSSIFMAGSTFEFTFDEEGSYDYFCMVHPWMTGIINVN